MLLVVGCLFSLLFLSLPPLVGAQEEVIKVGILHSLTGTISISEKTYPSFSIASLSSVFTYYSRKPFIQQETRYKPLLLLPLFPSFFISFKMKIKMK